MLTVKFVLRCDQPMCPETFEQSYENLQPIGNIPMPSMPPSWQAIPKLGLLCDKHEITIKPTEASCPTPKPSGRLS